MRDAGGELAERGKLLGLDQAVLRRLQLAQGPFGRVPRRLNFRLGALALRDIGIDHYEAAVWHRVASHFYNAAIRPRTFQAHLLSSVVNGAAQLLFEIGRVFTTLSKIAEVVCIARP